MNAFRRLAFAVAAHLERGLAVGLGWGFVLMACAILLAFGPAFRLIGAAHGKHLAVSRVTNVGRIVPRES